MTQSSRPNILLLFVDDLFSLEAHRDVFGYRINTPNIDKIAARGTRFDNAYAAVPVCGPSRAATLTGLSPHTIGLLDNDSDWKDYLRPEHAVQYRIKRSGYRTVTQGKVFHGYGAQPQHVYDALYDNAPFNTKLGYYPPGNDFTDYGGFKGGLGYHSHEECFYDSQIVETAIKSIQAETGKQPFYMEVGLRNPHTSRNNPARFFDDIALEDINLPDAWKAGWSDPDFPTFFQSKHKDWNNHAEWSPERLDIWRRTVRAYIASIHFLDFSVGRVLDALDASPFAENTIILFMTDHGMHLGDRGQTGKFSCYEGSIRTPLIISVPGQEPRVVTEPVAMPDIAPTLLDYCEAPPAKHHVGQSLRPLIEGVSQQKVESRGIPTFWYGSVTMRTQDRRLTLWQDGTIEHHNVENDFWQQTPLKNDPNFDKDYALLKQTCRDWGLSLSRDGEDLTCAAHSQSRCVPTDTKMIPAAGRVSAIGHIDDTLRPPGDHMLWTIALQDGQEIRMPAHFRTLKSATRQSGGPTHMKIVGNTLNNVIDLSMMTWPSVEVELGPGNDTVTLGRTRGIITCGPGENLINGSHSNDRIYIGPGNTTARLRTGKNIVECRSGKNQIFLGHGHDTVIALGGTNHIIGGKGSARIEVKCGKTIISPSGKVFSIVFHRTGRPQLLTKLRKADVIDIQAWTQIEQPWFKKSGQDVVVTCGRESLQIANTSVSAVQKLLKFD